MPGIREDSMPIDIPRVVWRALRLRCPNCGSSGFFESWFRIRKACHICGYSPSRSDEGYGMGALTINMVVSELIAVGVIFGTAIIMRPDPPWDALLYIGLALAVGLPLFFYPFATSLFVAINHALRVSDTQEPEPRQR